MMLWSPVRSDRGDRTGQVIGGRYRIDGPLGRGAMAEVYRAHDRQNGCDVALKIMKRSLSSDAAVVQRFAREADVQSVLRHRNIAALLATGMTEQEEPYLVVELLRGKTLRHALKEETKLPPRKAASYAWQALQGLAAVHRAGVLHRDLKPANIMLEPSPGPFERVALIDFGFAALEGAAKLTMQGMLVGSLTYIAPERLRDEQPDRRSDLYAIGAILHEMLDGAPPFHGDTDIALVEQHLEDSPPELGPDVPERLRAIVSKALEKLPEQRFADADDMAAAIERAAQTLAA